MKKFATILEEHLERVSYDVMEQYSDVLRDMIKGRSVRRGRAVLCRPSVEHDGSAQEPCA